MEKNLKIGVILLSMMTMLILFPAGVHGQQLAFPTAEGSGRYATGGRGGDVYQVTNLNNSGPGSIVDAVSSGNRTIVFRVSGTIELGDVILRPKSNTTIAGQTAPGDGICIKGRIYIGSVSNIVIRYLRVRVDAGAANSSGDAIDIAGGTNIIIDHVSASYARDEGISCQPGSNHITVQWCIISEALTYENHGYGSLVRGDYGDEKSYHHNLYAHNQGRNPRPGNYLDITSDPEGLHFDFRNNVVYNYGGSKAGYNADNNAVSRYNFVGNAYVRGPESSGNLAFRESSIVSYGYFANNSMEGVVPEDPWSLVELSGFTTAEREAYRARSYEVPMDAVFTTSPEQAKTEVLAMAGASLPRRDTIDKRIVSDVLNKTGHSIATTNDQPEGAWPLLNSTTAPLDDDADGMPNEWETKNGLDKDNPEDRNTIGAGGYTNLENYLNSISGGSDYLRAPLNIEANLLDFTKIMITWEDQTDNESGFRLERSEGAVENFITIAELPANSTQYIDSLLSGNTQYKYRVLAFKEDMSSGYDGIATVKTRSETSLPLEVSGPSPEDNALISETRPTLMWEGSFNAESYDVYFGDTNPPSFKGNQVTTAYSPEKLEKGTSYFWRIDGKNSNGTTTGQTWSFSVKQGLNAGQLAYWKLDESEGLVASDDGPFKLNGVLTNMDPAFWYTGKVDGGLLFDGQDDYIMVPYNEVLDPADESFSLLAWVYTETLPETSMYLMNMGSFTSDEAAGSNGRWYGIDITGDIIRFTIDDNLIESEVEISGAATTLPYKWTHIAGVRDTEEGTLKLYVNGKMVSSANDETGSISQEGDLYFGNNQAGSGPLYGILDDITIFNYALSDSEVRAVSGLTSTDPAVPENNLIRVQNYPNPFTSTTSFNYHLASKSEVRLSIYNAAGSLLSTPLNEQQAAGEHRLTFDAGNLDNGVYIYELQLGPKVHRGRMILLK